LTTNTSGVLNPTRRWDMQSRVPRDALAFAHLIVLGTIGKLCAHGYGREGRAHSVQSREFAC
jgi:hypothetical protein